MTVIKQKLAVDAMESKQQFKKYLQMQSCKIFKCRFQPRIYIASLISDPLNTL